MKKFIKIFPLALLCIGLTSCLKDESLTAFTDDAPNMLEFSAAATDPATPEKLYPAVMHVFDYEPETAYSITVSYSGDEVAPRDIEVEVAVDPSAITRFNDQILSLARAEALAAGNDPAEAVAAAQSKLYTLATSAIYTLPSTKVVIKKGERTAELPVTVKPVNIDFDHRYVLPLKIVSGSGNEPLSGNFNTVLFHFMSKNAYDGAYDHTFTSSLGNGSNKVTMSTIGKNTVTFGLLGQYSNAVVLTVDEVTNKVTVSLTTLLPIATDPSSYYDPATQTFHLKWTSNGGARTFEETFVKIK